MRSSFFKNVLVLAISMQTWQWQKYFIREKIIHAIREFFYNQKFHEVETPLLVPAVIPESYLTPFETYLYRKNNKKQKMYLTASPEASIKKLLAAGIGDCFEITRSFRNTDTRSPFHNPEFTILEWYRVNADYKKIMEDCERLIIYIYIKLKAPCLAGRRESSKLKAPSKNLKLNNFKLIYRNNTIDLTPPWMRFSVDEALRQYAGISLVDLATKSRNHAVYPLEKIMKIALKKGYMVSKKNTWEEIFHQIFLNEIEPQLAKIGRPVFLYDYPRPLASLSRIKPSNPLVAERFELYIAGLELANCFTELTDPAEQKKRFQQEMNFLKKKKGLSITPDLDFLKALETGLPPSSGIALGVDRLVMLFTNSTSVKDIILFPL